MPGSTVPFGFPYPVGGDPFTDPAGDIQALAEAVDPVVQALFDQVAATSSPPAAQVTAGTTQVAGGSTVAPPLTTVAFDNDGLTSTLSVNPYELIIQTAGVYAIWGSILWPTSASTVNLNFGVGLFVNGVQVVTSPVRSRSTATSGGGSWRAQFSTLETLSIGDRVALGAYLSVPTVLVVGTTAGGTLGLVRVAP